MVGGGDIWMVVELSTKKYPTNIIESWEIQYLKTSPWPESRRQLSRGVLTISHIYGAAQFPCPGTCVGGVMGRAHLSPTHVV